VEWKRRRSTQTTYRNLEVFEDDVNLSKLSDSLSSSRGRR